MCSIHLENSSILLMYCPKHTYRHHVVVSYQLVHVNSAITNLQLLDRKNIRNASRKKDTENHFRGISRKKKSEVSPSILEYWNIRNELSYTDGLILKGSKLFVPRSLRTELLQKTNT